ncbi:MAG: hypothetical protein AAFR23_03975, partial [Pseudomonadota bacterium]
DPDGFFEDWRSETDRLRQDIVTARARLADITCDGDVLEAATRLCIALGTDGLRGELTLVRAATAFAALDGAGVVRQSHLEAMAASALRHRLRRNPLDESGSTTRVLRAIADVFTPRNEAEDKVHRGSAREADGPPRLASVG